MMYFTVEFSNQYLSKRHSSKVKLVSAELKNVRDKNGQNGTYVKKKKFNVYSVRQTLLRFDELNKNILNMHTIFFFIFK